MYFCKVNTFGRKYSINGRLLAVVVLLLFSMTVQAQEIRLASEKERVLMAKTLIDGEEMLWAIIPEVRINYRRTFSSKDDEARYRRLKHNVLKVLPYAHFAQQRYEQLHRDLAMTGNKREQRRLVRTCEKEIKDMFNREVKNLSVSQGQILIKLIDRQTGQSSYEVVRELRGGVTAFFYQSVAKIFGHNLKSNFDPEEDREIENILRSLHYQTPIFQAY